MSRHQKRFSNLKLIIHSKYWHWGSILAFRYLESFLCLVILNRFLATTIFFWGKLIWVEKYICSQWQMVHPSWRGLRTDRTEDWAVCTLHYEGWRCMQSQTAPACIVLPRQDLEIRDLNWSCLDPPPPASALLCTQLMRIVRSDNLIPAMLLLNHSGTTEWVAPPHCSCDQNMETEGGDYTRALHDSQANVWD